MPNSVSLNVNLGLIPGYGGTQRLVQVAGKGRAMELLMSGRTISAQEAQTIGMVNEVVPQEKLIPRNGDPYTH